jgi:hypothetical protein
LLKREAEQTPPLLKREAERTSPVEDMMEQSWESERPPGASPSPGTRLRPPPLLTHEDNRAFLEMLREKKEMYATTICVRLMRVAWKLSLF